LGETSEKKIGGYIVLVLAQNKKTAAGKSKGGRNNTTTKKRRRKGNIIIKSGLAEWPGKNFGKTKTKRRFRPREATRKGLTVSPLTKPRPGGDQL